MNKYVTLEYFTSRCSVFKCIAFKGRSLKSIALYFLSICMLGNVANADEALGEQQVFNQSDNLSANLAASSSEHDPAAEFIFPINAQILSLKTLSEHDRVTAQVKLLEFQALSLMLNKAEQYILYLVRANIANVEGQEYKVINWLNKAIKLEPSLAKKQLDTPLFAGAYLVLAHIYAGIGEDKKAFDNKKLYIKKYFSHLEQQKTYRLKRLNEKYDLEKRKGENELLTQNSQIKHFDITRAESDRQEQNRNITIFIAAVIVLFLLLLRQFKIRRSLKLLAKTDSLTLLPNRHSFFKSGRSYMKKALSEGKELSVLMLDIDHFKKVNDTFGHDVGDQAICNVAALASETMRDRDFLARIGGEEFAAILPDANIEQARAIAERMREKIQDSTSKTQLNKVAITVSIGLASIKDVTDNFDSLLHAADVAMYQAKTNGRNRVCSYHKER
ncbi:GGDEF domain-containing protein [Colwellia sp. Arc7-635]|uniref:GGDEF domain-containing protein n=1 Tax=Colwellia sp. Arc7-635 TaxID=2497879 RepID=UPI000F84F1A3|nr:GGDEF domain-containing protein [Colwellia sp. Arc7-635]AZQ85206.1 GGDEF domain-containing protein [Colwellia sp. Arc7-635]